MQTTIVIFIITTKLLHIVCVVYFLWFKPVSTNESKRTLYSFVIVIVIVRYGTTQMQRPTRDYPASE